MTAIIMAPTPSSGASGSEGSRAAGAVRSGGLAVLLLGGVLVWVRQMPAYGRWGFDTSTIDPAVRPGDSFFDHVKGADSAGVNMRGVIEDTVRKKTLYIVTKALNSTAASDTD